MDDLAKHERALSGPKRARPWYRLHASTYFVVLLAATVLFFANVPGQYTVHVDLFNSDRRAPILDERIQHGWPWTYLVREEQYVRDSATGKIRPARIWSFTDAFVAFRPWRLAADVFMGTLVLAGSLLAFEYWRRQRQRIWQLRITDLFGLTAIIAATFSSGLQSRKEFLRDMAASPKRLEATRRLAFLPLPIEPRGASMSAGTSSMK